MTEAEPQFYPQGQVSIKIDRSAEEQRLINEKEAVQKQLNEAETRNKELEAKLEKMPKPTGSVPPNSTSGGQSSNTFDSGRSEFPAFADIPSMMKYVVNSDDPKVKQIYDNAFRQAILEPTSETYVLDSTLEELIQGKGRWVRGKPQNRIEGF